MDLIEIGAFVANDYSYSGTLSSTVNSWIYTPNLGFDPDYVYISKVRYYNAGSDTATYLLKSNLFSNDAKRLGTIFSEDSANSNNWLMNLHCLKGQKVNGNSFNFEIIGAVGTGQPSAGSCTVMLTFVKLKSPDQY